MAVGAAPSDRNGSKPPRSDGPVPARPRYEPADRVPGSFCCFPTLLLLGLEVFPMTRLFIVAVPIICLSLGADLLPALAQAPEKAAPPKDAPATKAREETLTLIRMLEQPIETKDMQEPVKLKVALEHFSDHFGGKLSILVDKNAFSAELGPDSEDPYETEVCLPPVPAKMSVDRALRAIITQIGNGKATYVIRRNWIEITTLKHSAMANSLHHLCIVKSFEQQPLPDVLQ